LLAAAFAIRLAGAAIAANTWLAGAFGSFVQRHAALAFSIGHGFVGLFAYI